SISCCSNVTRSALSSERKRYSVCVPLRRLRSLVCTMPRQLPGVTCTTFITRQRSFWCWMIMPTRSCVAGINIGTGPPGELGDGSSPLAPGLGARQPGACDAPPAGGRMSTGTITVSHPGRPARRYERPDLARHGCGTAVPGGRTPRRRLAPGTALALASSHEPRSDDRAAHPLPGARHAGPRGGRFPLGGLPPPLPALRPNTRGRGVGLVRGLRREGAPPD